jgi:uncharacterized circularly permuted ATP-grasp superfamily protein/uncharacterized alpha-E superfamily protein
MKSPSSDAFIAAGGAGHFGYVPRAGLHDEMVGPPVSANGKSSTAVDGSIRPHWQQFLSNLDHLGLPELTRRWQDARQLIRENGVTYNVYGDPRGMDRPWQLDPVPLLISPTEYQNLEAGLIQRGRLLEKILADLYGAQMLLHGGLIPPEIVFANPGFLRPCRGISLPNDRYLHLYAANLGRSPDGSLWVLGDRTQSPSGAGYTLENRIVLSRMLPDAFRDCRVQRLALFFRTLRDTLRSIAPHNRDNPRIVLLTPGPFNETYFEHAYLARYLGYTLVEGGDLTVRDNKVFLRVLGGLQPVDVIFRRLDDDFCDPVELRSDSFLGVPGLVQAVRAGNVAVANALGSGLLETPALLAFLPALCRHFLGEKLLLPSVPTWWCGEPQARDYVLDHLSDMIIKPAFASMRRELIITSQLSPDKLRALAEQIRAQPRNFVGQERLPLSTTPVLAGSRLEPRQMVMRIFLTAKDDAFTVMPGGLTRFSGSAETMVVSMQRGGGSKDTWVLAVGPVSTFSLLPARNQLVELSRGGSDLPSRVADNLFWLGRNAERAEGLTRLLRGILVRLTEKSGLADVPELPALLGALSHLCKSMPGFVGEGAEERLASPEKELLSLIFDPQRSGSLAFVLKSLARAAGTVRDRISLDMWRVLSSVSGTQWLPPPLPRGRGGQIDEAHAVDDASQWAEVWVDIPETNPPDDRRKPSAPSVPSDEKGPAFRLPDYPLSTVLDLLNRTVATLAAFGGLAMESMTRGQGWRFLDIGRRLERCLHIIGLLRRTLSTVHGNEGPLLEALLEIADSSMTYRRRYQGSLQTAAVLDLLLADETNPRSLAYQLTALADDVDHLPSDNTRPARGPEQRIMLAALTALRLADVSQLALADTDGSRPRLKELLDRLAKDLPDLSDSITQSYLSHLQIARHLAGTDGADGTAVAIGT